MIIKEFPFSDADWSLIEPAIRACHSNVGHRTSKVWFKAVDIEHVLTQIKYGNMHAAYIDNSYVVVYSFGVPWYSSDVTFIEEHFVCAVNPTTSFDSVTKFMDLLAEFHNADYIAVGTALAHSNGSLVRLYQRHDPGYQPECIQLIKEA
jgi:hypothetical protein